MMIKDGRPPSLIIMAWPWEGHHQHHAFFPRQKQPSCSRVIVKLRRSQPTTARRPGLHHLSFNPTSP
jgi:hypothetical protein